MLFRSWGVKPDELRETWKRHLAAIINNRTVGWDRIVLSLGDRLCEIGDVKEAHFCYMVCGWPITSPTEDETRVALLGCKHSDYNDLMLLTEEALLAYERTEAYEWAKRQANKDAYFVKFQPFKLLYAMLLADAGEAGQAQKIIKSMRLSSNNLASVTEIKKVSVSQMFDDSVALVKDRHLKFKCKHLIGLVRDSATRHVANLKTKI